ncbi:MAG: AraC family transcriptional regulator [Sphingobacterium sp.]|jgi:AraC-like DNA-binding protein|nr:AraC family transcriptional regulator [Sphingobacterium sp.]
MDNDYNIKFSKAISNVKDLTGQHVAYCRYPVPFSHQVILFRFDGGHFIDQKMHYDTFHINLFQLDSNEPIDITYRLEKSRIFFNFILHGAIDFTTEEHERITQVSACTFYLSYEQPGSYQAKCNKGETDAIIISVLSGWASSIVDNYPILYEAINQLSKSKKRFEVLPHCRIDDTVKELLFGILAHNHSNKRMQDLLLSFHIGQALIYYERLLLTTTMGKMYQIKQYIEKHILNPEIDIKSFAAMVSLSQQTVTRRFKEIYGLSIRSFYHLSRMQYVELLIEDENMSIKEASRLIGYADENDFRKAYKKFLLNKKNQIHRS